MAVAFFWGVSQITWSTPGVAPPLFSVTRLTARALPLNEWVSRRCKALTLPHLPCCVALTIRAWSRRTLRWMADQSMVCQFTSLWEAAPANVFAVICLASCICLPSFLVLKDQTEVCSLSRGMMLPLGSIPIHPITGRPSLFPFSFARNLIGRPCSWLSLSGRLRVSHVPYAYPDRVGSASAPVDGWSASG